MIVEPPDGGVKAWVIMVCSFLVNGIVFSIINTFGILFVKLKEDLETAGVEDAAFKCATVGSLAIGCTFFLSFFAGIITDKIGLRMTSMLGGVLATLGLGLSAIFYTNIKVLYLTYGLLFGGGASLAYNPSLTILGHYFRRHLGLVNGIVTAGSSVFTILLSFVNPFILENHGLRSCLVFLTVLSAFLIVCGFSFTPLVKKQKSETSSSCSSSIKSDSLLRRFIHVENWHNKKFIVWSLSLALSLFGYFVPFVHLVQFAKNIPLDESDHDNSQKAAHLMACIGITSGLGRLLFGKLSDLELFRKDGNRIVLQQVAFFSMGVCTMLLTVAPLCIDWEYQALLCICCVMGLFDGCWVTLLGPIAFDLCGATGAAQAIGSLLAMFSVPMTIGPPVAGIIYDKVGSYTPAFLAAGLPPVIGSGLMTIIKFISNSSEPSEDTREMSTVECGNHNKENKNDDGYKDEHSSLKSKDDDGNKNENTSPKS